MNLKMRKCLIIKECILRFMGSHVQDSEPVTLYSGIQAAALVANLHRDLYRLPQLHHRRYEARPPHES
jgi:hypothetical protein